MITPQKINLKIYKGTTFRETFRWESDTKVYASITGITKAAPTVITAPGHTVVVGWRAKLSNILGMTELNSDAFYTVSETTSTTITINDLNSTSYKDYVSSGVITYNKSMNLVGATARLIAKIKQTDTVNVIELTTENGGIAIDPTLNTITINIDAEDTLDLDFSSVGYDLEIILSTGDILPMITGTITLVL